MEKKKKIKISCQANQTIALEELNKFQGNIKSLSEENLDKLKKRIVKKGFRYPFFVWKENDHTLHLLDGHQRYKALESLQREGWEIPALPVHFVFCRSLKEAKEEVLAISSQYGRWVEEELEIYIKEWEIDLSSLSLDTQLTFDRDFLDDFLEINKEERNKEAECEKREYVSQKGSVWSLNDHILICDSSCEKDLLEKALEQEDKKNILVFTDPPYGIDLIKNDKRNLGASKKIFLAIEGDQDTQTAKEFYHACKSINLEHFVLWGGNYFSDFLPPSPVWFVWDKKIDEGLTFSQGEMAWTSFSKGGVGIFSLRWCGLIRDGLRIDNLYSRIHPNQKPVELLGMTLKRLSGYKFSTILDGFCGSGSFLIASEKEGKRYIGFELMPAYCDASVKRWVEWMQMNKKPFFVKKDGEFFKDFDLL